MIRAIIIDDETQARKLLSTLIAHYCSQIVIVEECADLPNGVKAIRKHKPDLIFLDLEMPGHSGLELLEFFDEKDIQFGIIFTTAYNEYAVKAFKLSEVDYLLKPIYHLKFGWKPVTQFRLIRNIPFIRNFFTTCVYYLIKSKNINQS